jgi:hypothetical protein
LTIDLDAAETTVVVFDPAPPAPDIGLLLPGGGFFNVVCKLLDDADGGGDDGNTVVVVFKQSPVLSHISDGVDVVAVVPVVPAANLASRFARTDSGS